MGQYSAKNNLFDSKLWLPMSTPNQTRPIFTEGKGNRVCDKEDNFYVDFSSGLWNMPLGYNNNTVINAISAQIQKLSFANPELYSSEAAEEYAANLLSHLPKDFAKVFLATTGSEAVEIAIKLVRRVHSIKKNTKKKLIGAFNLGYHGSYYGSLTATGYGESLKHGYGPFLEGFIHLVPPIDPDGMNNNIYSQVDFEARRKLLFSQLEELSPLLSALIIEPVFGSSGVINFPQGLLKEIANFCQRNDILLVFDEITTGFCRTDSLFYFEQVGITPDILLLSKGINNGVLPLSAVVVSEDIVEAFSMTDSMLYHLSTQDANPICAVAADAVLKELTNNRNYWQDKISALEAYLSDMLQTLLAKKEQVVATRQVGLMAAIELKQLDTNGLLERFGLADLDLALRNEGILITESYTEALTSCLILMPSFVTEKQDIEMLEAALLKHLA